MLETSSVIAKHLTSACMRRPSAAPEPHVRWQRRTVGYARYRRWGIMTDRRNVIVALHYQRRGMPWWAGLRPWAFPFRHFKTWEWLALLLLGICALTLIGLGLRPGP